MRECGGHATAIGGGHRTHHVQDRRFDQASAGCDGMLDQKTMLPRSHRGWRTVAAVVVVGSAALMGCSPDQGSGPVTVVSASGDAAWLPTAAATEPPSLGLGYQELLTRYGPPPLDAFRWSADDMQTVQRAQDRLESACLERQGFSFTPVSGGPPATEPVTHFAEYLGLVSLERATAIGYRILSLDARKWMKEQQSSPPTDTSPAYVTAATACLQDAITALALSGTGIDRGILGRLYEDAVARAQSDPGVLAAKQKWVTCMAAAGYQLQDIPMPYENEFDQGRIDQAVADVTCKQTSNIIEVYITTLYAAEKVFATQHADELARYVAAQDERVHTAATALGS